MKRVIIVHGWDDSPSDHWLPWLIKELIEAGYAVEAPSMPDTSEPMIEPWVSKLNSVVGQADEDTYYVGHSIGCQTIMRHLGRLSESVRVGGAVFVAPWFKLENLSGAAEEAIAKPWIETSIDFEKVRSHLPKLTAFFSDDDPWVVLENVELFKERLGAETRMLTGKKHVGIDSDMTEFPELLTAVEQL